MRALSLTTRLFAACTALALCAPTSVAQLCQDPGDTFWKNDVLVDAPVGVPASSNVAIAICNGEAVGTYFQLAPGSKPQHLKQVSVGWAHTGGETDHPALLSIEIYEGSVGFNPGGVLSMPTKIFDLEADEGLTMTVNSDGISAYDVSDFNIVVDENFCVVYRLVSNIDYPGCPGAIPGNPANFMTDSTTSCTPGLNVFQEKFTGWVDPADWQFSPGQPICPQFFGGNFVIRACTTDAGSWTDLGNGLAGTFGVPNLEGSGPLTEGSLNPLVLSNTLPSSPTFVVIGFSSVFGPLKGGVLVPAPDLFLNNIPTNAGGSWSLAAPWPGGVPSGFLIYWQVWIPDAGGPINFAASNGVVSEAP